jgi:hypothetical protein
MPSDGSTGSAQSREPTKLHVWQKTCHHSTPLQPPPHKYKYASVNTSLKQVRFSHFSCVHSQLAVHEIRLELTYKETDSQSAKRLNVTPTTRPEIESKIDSLLSQSALSPIFPPFFFLLKHSFSFYYWFLCEYRPNGIDLAIPKKALCYTAIGHQWTLPIPLVK